MKTFQYNFQIIIFALFALILLQGSSVFSQQRGKHPLQPRGEKPGKPSERVTKVNKNFPVQDAPVLQREISAREKNLMTGLKTARMEGNKTEISSLQKQLNEINGTVSRSAQPSGYVRKADKNSEGAAKINISQIFSGNDVAAITTATEQIGANIGRMWAVVAYNFFSKSTYSETRFYFSDDNGVNWTDYAYAFNPYETVVTDAIDAEIIEDTEGNKFLYVAYGAETISSGKYICNLITLTITGEVGGVVQRLEWPGFDYNSTDVNYYKPRLATDNAFWIQGAYLYIAACQDSIEVVNGSGTDVLFSEKVAACFDPYSPSPGISYKAENYFYFSVNANPFQGNCDIAWFDDPDNGGGSVILVESGAYFVTAIYMYVTPDVGYLNLPTYDGYLDPDLLDKSSAYVAANGLYQNVMIVNVSEYDVLDHDIQYFETVDGGDNWTDGFISYTFDDDQRPDITGKRNVPGNFYESHVDFNLFFDNVFYSVARENTWSPQISPMNSIDASAVVGPRPGIKLGGADSCFVIWTEYANNSNAWGSAGCNGTLSQVMSLQLINLIEGFYDDFDYMIRSDTITISFRQSTSPYSVVQSKKTIMSNTGISNTNFDLTDNNTDYFISINHRNAIETWTNGTINFSGDDYYYYDFTTSSAQAFGGNQILLNPANSNSGIEYYGFFSGDVNQDGSVDLSDGSLVDNDSYDFVSGYVPTDVNGDDFVDLSDLTIVDNNSYDYVSKIVP